MLGEAVELGSKGSGSDTEAAALGRGHHTAAARGRVPKCLTNIYFERSCQNQEMKVFSFVSESWFKLFSLCKIFDILQLWKGADPTCPAGAPKYLKEEKIRQIKIENMFGN